ncbi:hypothetical protein [Paenibacillus amylolyticus]|uniref:hypothetical protein n=1 Tax=Paenibacillus amylolyticus TaxID=1451 RepID=UPI003EBB922F
MTNNCEKIRPYNDMWLDCVSNNLVAMLINENESYADLSCYMDSMYLKKVYQQSYSSEDIQGELLAEGLYYPKIEYSLELLGELIDTREEEFDSLDDDVHGCIKSALGEDCFVFVSVDRYFYPSGLNANKSHLYHPTFIYGYDYENQCYKALEDCMVMGRIDYFRIPYGSIDASCKFLLNEGKKIRLGICKVKDTAKEFTQRLQLPKLAESLERHLAGGQVYNKEYDLFYDSGMDALLTYTKEFNYLFSNLKVGHLFSNRALSYCQVHMRNQKIAQIIQESYCLDMAQIKHGYSALYEMWRLFKNKSYYLLEKQKKAPGLKHSDYLELNSLLMEITERERDTADLLLQVCRSVGG